MIRLGLLLAAGLALPLAACQPDEPAAETPPRPVKSMVIRPFRDQAPVFTGVVEPRVSTVYSFRLLGRIVDRDVDVGDLVSKGERLAALETTVLQQAVDAAEASAAGANATLANAVGVEARQRALRQTNTATQADLDNAVQALEAARSAATQAVAALAKAREQLGYANLLAEFDGVVTAVSADPGQVVAAGQSVVTVASPDRRDAVVDLPDAMAGRLALGTALDVALQLAPTIRAAGSVREIAPLADPVTRTRRVKIALENPDERFRLGSIVTVALPGDDAAFLALPRTAVLAEDGASRVWVVAPDGTTVGTRAVTVRPAADGQLVVVDGLAEGERVVTAGVNSLAEGQRVRVDGAVK